LYNKQQTGARENRGAEKDDGQTIGASAKLLLPRLCGDTGHVL
jgi:hypothetical protein